MKKLLLLLAFLVIPAFAQTNAQPTYVTVTPSGTCPARSGPWILVPAGTIYTCQNGMKAINSGGGSGLDCTEMPGDILYWVSAGVCGGSIGLTWANPTQGATSNGLYSATTQSAYFPVRFYGTGAFPNDLDPYPVATSPYTGTVAGRWQVAIDATAVVGCSGTDSFKWSYNGGAFTPGVCILNPAVNPLNLGVNIFFGHTTGHTVGDTWEFASDNGNERFTESASPNSALSASLSGTGAGNIPNGTYLIDYAWATDTGDTYPSFNPVTVTVTDHTMDGKILVNSLPAIPSTVISARIIGWEILIADMSDMSCHPIVINNLGNCYKLAGLIDKAGSSLVINANVPSLVSVPDWLGQVDTSGPCAYGELEGRYHSFCYFQVTDGGILYPGTILLQNGLPDGFLFSAGAQLNPGSGMTSPIHGVLGTSQVQGSDGTGATGSMAVFDGSGNVTDGNAVSSFMFDGVKCQLTTVATITGVMRCM